jgi:small GTP-binding protein
MILEHPIDKSKIDLNLMIWDLMGQKEYEIFHKSTFKGASGAIIVCDITRMDTLDNVPTWVSNLFNITGNIPIIVIVIGNKKDLIAEKAFEFVDLEDIARVCKARAFLTSAKTGENVETVFTHLGEEILKLEE